MRAQNSKSLHILLWAINGYRQHRFRHRLINFDTIQVPWGSYSGDWPVNFNYEPAAKTVYSRSSSTTDVKDTKFEATSSLEAFGYLGIEAKSSTMDKIRTGVKLAATYLVGKKEAGEAAAKIIEGLTDKIKATESALTNSSKTVGYTNTIEAGKTDSQLFYITRTHQNIRADTLALAMRRKRAI